MRCAQAQLYNTNCQQPCCVIVMCRCVCYWGWAHNVSMLSCISDVYKGLPCSLSAKLYIAERVPEPARLLQLAPAAAATELQV